MSARSADLTGSQLRRSDRTLRRILSALPGLAWRSRLIPQLTLWATLWPLLRSFPKSHN